MGHSILQLAYHGVPLADAHRRIWEEVCSPALDDLEAWYALDCEFRRVRGTSANSQAGRAWLKANPLYRELAVEIEAFQDWFLADYRWEGKGLTEYYRWSKTLAGLRPEEVLLAEPLLVEGELLAAPHPPPPAATAFGEEVEGPGRGVRWLLGELEDVPVPVVGVPDVIARDGDGLLFADYKFSRISAREDIEQDLQLLLYVTLAQQRGIALPGQKVTVGHIYPTEKGEVVKVWAGTGLYPLLLPELRRLFADMAEDVAAGRFRRVRGIDHFSVAPCGMCDMAHLCDPGGGGIG
jgi:hypothetical protein